jgi:hypothetical protein
VPTSGSGAYTTSYKTKSLQLPVDLPPGTWYVGVVIDTDDTVDESREDNNTLVIHQSLVVF